MSQNTNRSVPSPSRGAGSSPVRRVTFKAPLQDTALVEWLDRQENVSASLRLVLAAWTDLFGTGDVALEAVAAQLRPKAGLLRGEAPSAGALATTVAGAEQAGSAGQMDRDPEPEPEPEPEAPSSKPLAAPGGQVDQRQLSIPGSEVTPVPVIDVHLDGPAAAAAAVVAVPEPKAQHHAQPIAVSADLEPERAAPAVDRPAAQAVQAVLLVAPVDTAPDAAPLPDPASPDGPAAAVPTSGQFNMDDLFAMALPQVAALQRRGDREAAGITG